MIFRNRTGAGKAVICLIALVAIMAVLFWSAEGRADESALFTSVAPDALILLDLSGSMEWNPAGEHTNDSSQNPVNKWGTSEACTQLGSYDSATYNVNCSRVAIAKRAIKKILDDNGDGTIDGSDESRLNVRIGYMRFHDCSDDDTGGSYTGGCNRLGKLGYWTSKEYTEIGTTYSGLWSVIQDESANGGTPLGSALNEAKIYLDAHKAADTKAKDCRQKFVILITDGADTFSCEGDGQENQFDQYIRRREVVARTKALAAAGYKVFVIGFGSTMPAYLQNTLNWMAYYGNSDNPGLENTGSTSGYLLSGTNLYPGSITEGCVEEADADVLCNGTKTCDPDGNCTCSGYWYSKTNDPGVIPLSGYAYLASQASDLAIAVKSIINIVREANYSFTQSSVQSSRTADENFLYEGSFKPVTADPFWPGHLKKFKINADGTVNSTADFDAGAVLAGTAASSRNIKTLISGIMTDFKNTSTTTNITKEILGVASDTERDLVVGYIRGEATYNVETDQWKLGDIFRSTPVTIATPSAYYYDIMDTNYTYTVNGTKVNAFGKFRDGYQRNSFNSDGSLGTRVIVVGTNNGQLHGFHTGNMTEAWSFVPPNLLSKLINVAHNTATTAKTHHYFVDGQVTVADAWIKSDAGDATGKVKYDSEWQTLLIFGEGRGGTGYLWSNTANCDSGLSATYSKTVSGTTTTYPYYCGFYALNVTTSTSPAFKWILHPTLTQAPYLGEPWGKMMIGRVRMGTAEKWVGFIGAGKGADCKGSSCENPGRGFLVVDLKDGAVLWSFTGADSTSMKYSIPGSPAIVDTDNDGFIDTAYIGDLGGNIWRLKFCTKADGDSCGMSSSPGSVAGWSGGLLFDSSSGVIRPIYTIPSVARDPYGNLWVYWGTGDKFDPTAANSQEKFYGVKDTTRSTRYSGTDGFVNLGTTGTFDAASATGWYFNLLGEKMLADPVVFGGGIYFTTYTDPSGGNLCDQSGTSKLYAINYLTGGGILGSGRSINLDTGMASAPIVSLKPGGGSADIYVTMSGGAGETASTIKAGINPPNVANRTNILYWRDMKIR